MKKIIPILLVANLLFTAYVFVLNKSQYESINDFSKDVLKVRGIVVVDSLGVERAILAAHLPEAQRGSGRMYSSRSKTGVSGLMLYDSEGLERGGYVTDDEYGNIFLTLDSKDNQTALFMSEPNGNANLSLWSRIGNKLSFTVADQGIWLDAKKDGKNFKILTDE